MKKIFLKTLSLFLLGIVSIITYSCISEYEEKNNQNEEQSKTAPILGKFIGKICNGKQILEFISLNAFQQEYLSLYNQYYNGNEEEQILVDYEILRSFYSLRKKADNMAEGIIPDDPSFEETNYTLDPIMETFLNQDGMIIINKRIYLWDSGCLVQSLPFTCTNYSYLESFHNAAINNNPTLMHSIFVNAHIQNTNICEDPNFDFELIAENGGRIIPSDSKQKKSSGCGYEAVLNTTLESCQNGINLYKVWVETIEPINLANNPLNFFYIKGITGDVTNVEYSSTLIGGWIPIDTNSNNQSPEGYLIPLQQSFYLKIPQAEVGAFSMTLTSSILVGTGGSCPDVDEQLIDNACPFSITAIMNSLTSTESTWTFSITSGANCNLNASKITWYFGDGTSTTGGYSIGHTYQIPCITKDFAITAILEGTVCGVPNKTFVKYISLGDFCKREKYTFPPYKNEINGKKVKLRARLKRNYLGKSVFVNVFKGRVDGTKTIQSLGNIYYAPANNAGCQSQPITNILGTKSTTGKKRNRQKEKFNTIYLINAMDKYQVYNTHSTGFNHNLAADNLYCSE